LRLTVKRQRRRCFNPRPACGAKGHATGRLRFFLQFQSAPRVRGERPDPFRDAGRRPVSIRAPRAGRKVIRLDMGAVRAVSIRAPRAGRKKVSRCETPDLTCCVSIRAPRAGRKAGRRPSDAEMVVSIRAPRAGRKDSAENRQTSLGSFNPRPACGAKEGSVVSCQYMKQSFNPRPACGAKEHDEHRAAQVLKFQSAPRVRGESEHCIAVRPLIKVSIRAPRAGRKVRLCGPVLRSAVSIRAPRAGRKLNRKHQNNRRCGFQSAPRVRGESFGQIWTWQAPGVSIRAPRAGRKADKHDV